MASKDKIEAKDIIDSSVPKTFEELNKELAASVKLMTDLTKAAVDLNKAFSPNNIQQVVDSQKEYNKVNEESQKQNKETATTLEKLQKRIKDVSEEEERAKIALQEKRKEIRKNIAAQKDQTKESVKLNRELKKEVKTEKEATEQNKRLLKVRKEIDTTTAKGAKQVSLINKRIDKNNSLVKKNASALEKQKIEIGNYKDGVKDALSEQEFFGVSLNKISSGLKSGAGLLGAATAIIVGLGKAYASSARGAEDMARASDRLQSITKSLGNNIADATGDVGFFDALVNRLQIQFQGLAKTMESNVQVAILSTIRKLEIMDAEQERQKKAQLNRAEELRQIRDEERNSLEDRKKANDELGKVINERETDTVAHQEKILKNLQTLLTFNEGDLELQRQIKQVEFEIADAREEAQGFRSEMLANDLALSKEFIANELELQKTIIEGELQTSNDKFNLRKKLIDITRQLELEAAGENEQLIEIAKQKAINANQEVTKSIEDEQNKRNELAALDLEKKAENLEAEAEIEIEAFDEKLEREIEQDEALLDSKIESINKETEARLEADELKKQSVQEYTDFAIGAAGQLSNDIFGFLDAQSEAQKNADIEKAKSRGASEAEIEKIERDAAKKRKNRAITEAIINIALGVTSALANPGGILGIVIAALVAVSGALSIATISSASFAKGTKDSGSQGMIAEVGERGTERINYADGSSALTPNGSTYTYLPPHSEVVPNHRLQQYLADMQMIGNTKRSSQQDAERKRKEDQKELIRAIKNRDETTINITEGGFAVTATKGQNWTKYINRHYRN